MIQQRNKTKRLVEAALMIALSTILSILSIVEMPYGGSVTLASMLPILLISYRHGTAWGLGTGLAHALLQQLLGLKNLSYFTTWQSVLAIILLDYVIAFTLVGLGGIFRRRVKHQGAALALGGVLTCLLRYACHVISGATVWAGLSIPTEAALGYSIGYNATYMIPETVVLALAAYYLGSLLDFSRDLPVRLPRSTSTSGTADLLTALATLLAMITVAVDVSLLFAALQNPETGAFDLTLLAAEPFVQGVWLKVCVATAIGAVGILLCLLLRRRELHAAE